MFATRAIIAAIHAPDPGSDATDAELLRRFAETRDEGAFEALVRRHAQLVWAVCRRTLVSAQDAEDAFQAAFLVLARNPEKPRRSGTTAGFLFGVARRVALKIRTQTAARAARPLVPRPESCDDPASGTAVRELQAILDAEIARLPEAYRGPFVLCVLEGIPRVRAAAELGVNSGTLSSRLARARLLLRDRLAKRGVQLAAALAVTDLTASVSAVPPALVRATVACGVSGRASTTVALAGSLWGRRIVTAAVALMVCSAVAVGLVADGGVPSGDPPPPPVEKPVVEPRAVADARGDPLPAGAVARLGSTRWRHEGEAKSLSFSPDGKMLAVVSGNDGFVTFFETDTGKASYRLTEFGEADYHPEAIAFSPNGKHFAIMSAGGGVQLWDVPTKKLVRTLSPGPGRGVGSRSTIRFSPDGKRLAACTPREVVTIWNADDGKVATTLIGHNHANPAMAFSPDGKVLFLAAGNPAVQLWDATTGKLLRGFETGEGGAFSLAVTPDGKSVASGVRDRIIVFAVETGKELLRLDAKKMGAVLELEFTPDGKSLVSFGEDAKVRVWDLATPKESSVLDSRGWMGRSMALSADGKTVAAGTVYNVVRVWDVATGKELSAQADGHDAPIQTVAFAPNGKRLVTGGSNQQLHVWDGESGRFVQQLKGSSASQIAISPDGRLLASTWEWNKQARVRDLERGVELYGLAHEADRVPSVAFAQDGKQVLTLSWRWNGAKPQPNTPRNTGTLRTFDAATGKPVCDAALPGVQANVLALSSTGDQAGIGGWGEAPLWLCDLKRGHERQLSQEPWDTVKSIAFSPDGRMLAAGGVDRESVLTNGGVQRRVQIWEASTGRKIMSLPGHERTVTAVVFTPGSRILATADGGDNFADVRTAPQTIRFWDVATGKEVARFSGHDSDVTTLTFSPDGKKLVGGLHNGTALVWESPVAAKPMTVPGRKLGPRELAALWEDLAGHDAAVAHEAIRILAASPEQSVPYLASVLQAAPKRHAAKVRQRIADLGNAEFAVREGAAKELAEWGEDVERELQQALKGQPDAEVARRVQILLSAVRDMPPPDRRRELRAVWALELCDTPAAAKILAALAKGNPDARLTREARTALDRR